MRHRRVFVLCLQQAHPTFFFRSCTLCPQLALKKGLIARSPDSLSLLSCLLPKTLPLQRTSTICAYLPIVPRIWADIIHTPALVPPRVKSSWCVLSFQTTLLWSTDGPLSPIQAAAESEPPEENRTAENANTVCDLSGLDSRLFMTR